MDGYVVESLVADRGHAELICDAVGPDGEAVTLVVAWRRPADRHAWPRFRRLARTRAILEHEALLPVHAVGEHSGRPYLAMGRYPETTFEDLLDERSSPARQVLTLLAPVCDALDLAHANGLVHQSLSDTSLLMEDDSLLLDGFGVAGGPRELSFESVGVHEVRYCPPEELRGEPLEPASNVYSLDLAARPRAHRQTAVRRRAGRSGLRAPRWSPRRSRALTCPARHRLRRRGRPRHGEGTRGAARVRERAARARPPRRSAWTCPTRRGVGRGRGARAAPSAAIRIRRVPKRAVAAAVIVAALAGLAAGVVLDPFEGSRASAAGPSVDTRALERLDDQRTSLRATPVGRRDPAGTGRDGGRAGRRVRPGGGRGRIAAAGLGGAGGRARVRGARSGGRRRQRGAVRRGVRRGRAGGCPARRPRRGLALICRIGANS